MNTPSTTPDPGVSTVVAQPSHEVHYWINDNDLPFVIGNLWRLGLIKYKADASMPLKGLDVTTDIYFNIRLVRTDPEALKYVTGLFSNAIRYLVPDFEIMLDIPHAISPVISALMLGVNKPMITLRDAPKQGRVENAEYIGRFKPGQIIMPIDDVITTSGSKLAALKFAEDSKLVVAGLMVLVDRDDGPWRKELADRGITVPIFAGFALSKVRPIIQELAAAA